MKTSELIDNIVADQSPVKPRPRPFTYFAVWCGLTMTLLLVAVMYLGIRPDFGNLFSKPASLLQISSSLLIGFVSTFFVFLLSIPGQTTRKNMLLASIPIAAWLGLLVFRMVRDYVFLGLTFGVDNGLSCFSYLLVFGTMPGIILFSMIAYFAPTRLGLTGALGTISAASFASTAIQLHCPSEIPGHQLFWHMAPVLLVGLVGIYLGRKFLRW